MLIQSVNRCRVAVPNQVAEHEATNQKREKSCHGQSDFDKKDSPPEAEQPADNDRFPRRSWNKRQGRMQTESEENGPRLMCLDSGSQLTFAEDQIVDAACLSDGNVDCFNGCHKPDRHQQPSAHRPLVVQPLHVCSPESTRSATTSRNSHTRSNNVR